MTRIRWTAVALLVALVAPWAAPCLAAAPSDETMPCCTRPAPDAPPIVRPCCAATDQQPVTSGRALVAAIQGLTSTVGAAPFAHAVVSAPIHSPGLGVRSLDARLRSTILLI